MLYTVSIFLHFIAFIIGVYTIKKGAPIFEKTNILDCHKNHFERSFIAVFLSTIGNLLLAGAKIDYIFTFDANTTGAIEPIFVQGHLFVTVALVFYHYNAFELVILKIKTGGARGERILKGG